MDKVTLDVNALRSVLAGKIEDGEERSLSLTNEMTLVMSYRDGREGDSVFRAALDYEPLGEIMGEETYGVSPDGEVNQALVSLAVDFFTESMLWLQSEEGKEWIEAVAG